MQISNDGVDWLDCYRAITTVKFAQYTIFRSWQDNNYKKMFITIRDEKKNVKLLAFFKLIKFKFYIYGTTSSKNKYTPLSLNTNNILRNKQCPWNALS